MALRLPFDTDFWWHVRAGQDTLLLGKPLLQDFYSYTRLDAAWVNHSWLGQVVFYLIFDWFSLPGVMVFVAFIAALSLFFIYKTMRGPILLNAFILVLTVSISAVVWTSRPQIFTFLFLSLEQYILYQFRKSSKTNTFIILLFMFIVWSNLHAGFSLGIIFLALWFVGGILDRVFDLDIPFEIQKNDIYWIGVLILSSLVVMINPNGWNVWRVQFDTISVSVLQDFIPEWASPNFHELLQQPFLWAWLIINFLGLVSPKRIGFAKVVPLIFFGYLGFIARRNYGPFAILGTPILSELVIAFYQTRIKEFLWFKRVIKKVTIQKKEIPVGITKGINLFLFSILAFVVIG